MDRDLTNDPAFPRAPREIRGAVKLGMAPRRPQSDKAQGGGLALLLEEAGRRSARGDDAGALTTFEQAIALDGSSAAAWFGAGLAALRIGDGALAARCLRRAIALGEPDANARAGLGAALILQDDLAEAEQVLRDAASRHPTHAQVWFHLGRALIQAGKVGGAADALQRAADLIPQWAAPRIGMANLDGAAGRWSKAMAVYEEACRADPADRMAQARLANALHKVGRPAEALARHRQAGAESRGPADLHSNYLFALTHSPDVSREEVYREHLKFGDRFGVADVAPHANERDPDRRLKIGYVSGDLAAHTVANFIGPVLENHDPTGFEVHAYSTAPPIAGPPPSPTVIWHEAARLNDAELAAAVRRDGIDILVDLSGHTSKNRLPAFGRKPAPVQVTWIGYPNTTGLAQIDYRLSDARMAGPETQAFVREKIFRLPRSATCYRPFDDLPLAPPPCAASGVVTFGSTSAPSKLNDRVLDVWAQVLRRRPDSRLRVKGGGFDDSYLVGRITARLADRGIDPGRLSFEGPSPFDAYMRSYSQVDVLLDPFPYTGGSTTRNALWMGVPVVTLQGPALYERVSSGLLQAIGLEACVATSTEDYIDKAVALAGDPGQLSRLRQEIRPRLIGTGYFDPPGFTRELEAAFREMWRRWCVQTDGRSDEAG